MEQRNWPGSRSELQTTPIQVRVASVEQIFNPMDPTPLEQRSLNPEVADWIEEWAEDIDADGPFVIEIVVADRNLAGREELISQGIHHHFEYREWQVGRQMHRLLRDGRLSMLIGISALAALNAAARVIGDSTNPVVQTFHEGLQVMGWVSMWKPLDVALYQWWPVRRERRACRRLAEAVITFPEAPAR